MALSQASVGSGKGAQWVHDHQGPAQLFIHPGSQVVAPLVPDPGYHTQRSPWGMGGLRETHTLDVCSFWSAPHSHSLAAPSGADSVCGPGTMRGRPTSTPRSCLRSHATTSCSTPALVNRSWMPSQNFWGVTNRELGRKFAKNRDHPPVDSASSRGAAPGHGFQWSHLERWQGNQGQEAGHRQRAAAPECGTHLCGL